MNGSRPTFLLATTALSFGLSLGMSSDAQAAIPTPMAVAEISNGFLYDLGTVAGIQTVHFGRMGTLVEGGNSWGLSMQMTCELELSTNALDCEGTMTLNGTTADISMGHDEGDGYWAIEAVPTALQNAHIALMRTHVWPESQGLVKDSLPPGWSQVDIGGPYLWYVYDWNSFLAPWETDEDCLVDINTICT